MISIVYGHPYEKSFNHAILEVVVAKMKSKNAEHAVMDLYADHFDPAIRVEDMSLYGKGETNDPIAKMYMDILKKTDQVIFIYPIWWGSEPAIIRGFYDSVLLKGFAWEEKAGGGLTPLLKINKTTIFTTSEDKTEAFDAYFKEYLPTRVLEAVGMKNVTWFNCPNIYNCGDQARRDFLKYAADLV